MTLSGRSISEADEEHWEAEAGQGKGEGDGNPISEEDRAPFASRDVPERDEAEVIDHIVREVDRGQPQSQDDRGDSECAKAPRRRRGQGLPFSCGNSPTRTSAQSASGLSWWKRFKEFVSLPEPNPESSYRLIPIVSGICIPLSILLEIPGFTESWYLRTDANKTVEAKANPVFLNVVLAISMASAVAANLFFVFRLLEKRVKAMTILSIIFLTIHDAINITAITIFAIKYRFNDGFTYGQGFWMTVCSTAASLLTNITLIYDLHNTPDFEKAGSGLTRKQRSLVLIVIALLCYISLGALANTFILQLTFINGLYFTVVTIETVGFGDIVPVTPAARTWVCIYAIIGIITVAVVVTMIRETVIEGLKVSYQDRMKRALEHRREVVRRQRMRTQWRHGIEWRLRQLNVVVWVDDKGTSGLWAVLKRVKSRTLKLLGLGRKLGLTMEWAEEDTRHHHGKRLNLEALTEEQLEAAAMEAGAPLNELLPPDFRAPVHSGGKDRERNGSVDRSQESDRISGHTAGAATTPLEPKTMTQTQLRGMTAMLGRFALALNDNSDRSRTSAAPPPERDNESSPNPNPAVSPIAGMGRPPRGMNLVDEYESYKGSTKTQEETALCGHLVTVWSLFLFFWTIGGVIFSRTEGWTYGASMYFCFISFTTIGYGDLTPKTPAGRSAFVVWALLGVGTMTILVSVISEALSTRYKHLMHSPAFEDVVKRYRERISFDTHTSSQALPPPEQSRSHLPSDPRNPATHGIHAISTLTPDPITQGALIHPTQPQPQPADQSRPPSPETALRHTQTQLEALPQIVLSQVQTLYQHLQYFVRQSAASGMDVTGTAAGGVPEQVVTEALKGLLDEIAAPGRFGERHKQEILEDEIARNTLFTLSIEKSLFQMMGSAGQARAALYERDNLLAQRHRPERPQQGPSITFSPSPQMTLGSIDVEG